LSKLLVKIAQKDVDEHYVQLDIDSSLTLDKIKEVCT
jgi:hypothetical protein